MDMIFRLYCKTFSIKLVRGEEAFLWKILTEIMISY